MSEAHRPRVAFYTQGLRTPSARFRVEQLVPSFEAAGIHCTIYPANPSNQGETRFWSPPPGIMRRLLRALAVPGRVLQVQYATRHDIAFFQKPLLPYPNTRFEKQISLRRPCVFDLDDALYLKTDGERWIREIVALSSRIIVGNAHLAEWVGAGDRTTIIPTVVDTDRYLPRPVPVGPFTIGWTGIAHNLKDLEPLVPVLRRVLSETKGRLLVISERFSASWLRELPVECVPWNPASEVEAMARMHVGLMPLRDEAFNRAKCGFKLVQYMARSIPVVASPVGVNREIVDSQRTGYLARTEAEWEEALMSFYRDPDAASRMGTAARKHIAESYSVRAVTPRYVDLLRSLL